MRAAHTPSRKTVVGRGCPGGDVVSAKMAKRLDHSTVQKQQKRDMIRFLPLGLSGRHGQGNGVTPPHPLRLGTR